MPKPESGIKLGRLKFPGDFQECSIVDGYGYNNFTKKPDTFVGKYCRVAMAIPGILIPTSDVILYTNSLYATLTYNWFRPQW